MSDYEQCPRCGWVGNDATVICVCKGSLLDPPEYVSYCPGCGDETEPARVCPECGEVYGDRDMIGDICRDCASVCAVCDGTGIPASGPVEGRCGHCGGTGRIKLNGDESC